VTPALRTDADGATVGDMSFLDKAKDLLNQHDDKVDQALDKAGDAAKKKYGHEDQIDQAVGQGKQHTGGGDTTQAPPPPAEGEQPPPPQ
jgi:hypothetical protein